MGRQSAGTRWYENASLCVVIIVRQKQMLQYLSVSVMVIRDLKTAQRSHCSLFSGRLQTHQLHFTHLLACKARLDPPEVLAASWVQRSVGHGTCAFLLCNVPTFQPFPYGLRLAEESWQHLGSPRSSCQNALVHAHVASHTTPELAPTKYEYWHKNDDLWLATGVLCSWEMVKFQLRP